jgi:hypothetical protein
LCDHLQEQKFFWFFFFKKRTAFLLMDFIFMLTRDDRTVADCLDVMDEIAGLGLRHIGFKDIGVEVPVLRALNARIKAAGAVSYLEVVAETDAAALRSARMAVEIGVDRLLGGKVVSETLEILQGTGIAYYPFPGRPSGHPTRLGGGAADVAADCAAYVAAGCAGVDLLAYRATEAEPLDLVKAARAALGRKKLICAGGVDRPARIAALRDAGCDAFTVGSAAFALAFSGAADLRGQLRDILACA